MRPLVPAPASATDWQTRYYHSDHIGSVRRLTDESGAITDWLHLLRLRRTLSATAARTSNRTPSPASPTTPTWASSTTGRRWMDPRVGRFLAVDPVAGSLVDPRTLHKYSYAFNSPISLRDPSGRFPAAAFIGSRVHQEIGRHFTENGPGRFANYFPIFTILGIDPSNCVPFAAACLAKPDLVDTVTFEVYEIKPSHLWGIGLLELFAYVGDMDINDPLGRPWHFGATYMPPTYIFLPDLGGIDVFVKPPNAGVISYEAISRTGLLVIGVVSAMIVAGRALQTSMAQLRMQIALRPSPFF